MVEIGNYDSFYEAGVIFSPEQVYQNMLVTRSYCMLLELGVGRSLNTSATLFMIKVLSSRLYGGLECLRLPEKASGLHSIGPTASLSSLRHSGSPHSWEATLTRDNSNPLRVFLKFKFHRVQSVIFTHVGDSNLCLIMFLQILKLTKETRSNLPSITLSVTVPHTLSLPDQVKLAEMLEKEGVDVIQTEGGKCSTPSKSGVLGLIEKATPTLAAAYSISRAVKIPVMCSSGLSAVTAPMAITAGAAGVGVGSAVNKLNDVIAMVAEVRSIAESLKMAAADQQITHTDRSFMM
ncbi:hypothetical protein Gorai_008399 [Gossypium raimondii]|uniref:Uncharacterized protein ycf23 n=1 Tax=Gossypium raimondii TaxID=29730 RepID=A0A7J8QBG5_GOSRA|nr:hypothetical protein [Gossypium raimondii]